MKLSTRLLISVFLSSFCSVNIFYAKEKEKLPNDVRWVRDSNEYKSLCMYVFRKATESVQLQTGFLKASEKKERKYPYAVVVDLDETVLDNSQYQVERWRENLGFTQESWSEWVRRKEAKLVPGAGGFLKAVRENGVRVIFLSNRMHENLKPTQENLRSLQVLDSKDLFLLRRNKQDTKQIRRAEVLEGKGRMKEFGPFQVVAYVGDQMGDFPDGFSSELNHILFLLPNPMYGKW